MVILGHESKLFLFVKFATIEYMQTITLTKAKRDIKSIISRVKKTGEVFGIGSRNFVDAIIIKFPEIYNQTLGDTTNINAGSRSFDFLNYEPDIYSVSDLKKKYA